MSLDNKNNKNEEYFQPESDDAYGHHDIEDVSDPSDEGAHEDSDYAEEPVRKQLLDSVLSYVKSNKKIVFVIILVFVAFFMMQLGKVRHNKEMMQSKETAAHQEELVKQKKQADDMTQSAQQVNQLSSSLSDVKQKESAHGEQLDRLSEHVNDLQHTLSSLRSDQLKNNREQEALQSEMQHLMQSMNGWMKKQEQKTGANHSTVHATQKAVVVPVVYHTKAAVPGRAWLESNFGHATSVAIGDSLKGYGVVKAINADTGMVLMSSGKVIQYGGNDQ